MKSIVITVLIASILFLATGCVFNEERTYRKSKVDASPLAELNSEDIGRMLDVIERLESDDIITSRRIRERPGASQLLEVHDFNWAGSKPYLRVTVHFFETEQGAIDFTSSDSVYRNSQQHITRVSNVDHPYRRPFTFVIYDNGAEAKLSDSRANTNEYRAIIDWSITTELRLENYRIRIVEDKLINFFHFPATSKFIQQLVDMLQDTTESPIS